MAHGAGANLYSFSSETNVGHLDGILNSTRTSFGPAAGFDGLSVGYDRTGLGVDCDEVYPNVFIGDAQAAKSIMYLKHLGVSHVLNCAEGNGPGVVDTNADYHAGCNIFYMGLSIVDVPSFNLLRYFHAAAHFIECGIKSGGRVLIHCLKGRSRSATFAVAYLMLKMCMPAPMALRLCAQNRPVKPNLGFLEQLVHLDNSLRNPH